MSNIMVYFSGLTNHSFAAHLALSGTPPLSFLVFVFISSVHSKLDVVPASIHEYLHIPTLKPDVLYVLHYSLFFLFNKSQFGFLFSLLHI